MSNNEQQYVLNKMTYTVYLKVRGGMKMTKKDEQNNNNQSTQNKNSGGPAPLSGSHKVKNRQHTRQKHNSHHDL